MTKKIITTPHAPQAIGAYSQAIQVGNTVYLSGQIPLIPESMTLRTGGFAAEFRQVLDNIRAVAYAAGGDLRQIVKMTIYLRDFNHYPIVNEVMAEYFQEPYPARAVIGASALPKDASVEVDAIMVLE